MDIRVPAPLLREPGLTPSAKLIWMVLQLLPDAQPVRLEALAGISRQSVLRGLAQLKAYGQGQPGEGTAACVTRFVEVPEELICDRRVSVQGRLLYALLSLEFGDSGAVGEHTFPELAVRTGRGPNTVKRAIGDLRAHGWVQTVQTHRGGPVRFLLRNPAAERREAEVTMASRRIEKAENVGEQIMREFLSLLVESDEYEDESAPGFLVNPLSGELLRFDRYYPPRVGFEFNGPQHYGPTDRYPDPEQAIQQQVRDCMKIGMSMRRGLSVVTVHAEDLSLAAMRAKVEGLLPLRSLEEHGPLAQYLEMVGRRYRAKVARVVRRRSS